MGEDGGGLWGTAGHGSGRRVTGGRPGTEPVMSHDVIMIRSAIYEINSSQYLWESIG